MRWIQMFDRLRLESRLSILRFHNPKQALVVVLATLSCLYAAACAPVAPPTGDLLLENDDRVEGPDGLLLGALGRALIAPLPVWIRQVDPPGEALFQSATAKSAFYSFGAEQTTKAQDSGIFALAIPIPPGTDPSNLGLAVLVPASGILHGPEAGNVWIPLTGIVGADGSYLTVAIDSLSVEGSTVVLLEHPDFAPIVASATTESLKESASAAAFTVSCFGFELVPTNCTPDDEARFAGDLGAAYDDFAALGYVQPEAPQRPYLRYECILVESTDQVFRPCPPANAPGYRDIWISPPDHELCREDEDDTTQRRGSYDPRTRAMVFCFRLPGASDADYKVAARHELFHAFQHGFPLLFGDWADYEVVRGEPSASDYWWTIEGTAAAAETPGNELLRSEHAFRSVHWPLTQVYIRERDRREMYNAQYRTQDFWVYLGKKHGIGVRNLADLFRLGADADAVDRFLAGPVSADSLAEQYFGWVTNQAMERKITYNEPFPEVPCLFDLRISNVSQVFFPGRERPIAEQKVTGTLPRLTSIVYFIDIDQPKEEPLMGPIRVVADKTGGTGTLKYKIYTPNDTDCGVTGQNPHSPARVFDFEEKGYPSVYVVLSNVEHRLDASTGNDAQKELEYTISIQPFLD